MQLKDRCDRECCETQECGGRGGACTCLVNNNLEQVMRGRTKIKFPYVIKMAKLFGQPG